MCLILQKTCCSSLILKPWRLDQEISEEKLFIKAGQITRHLRTDSSTPLDSWWIDRESSCLLDSSSIASRYLYLSRFKARHLFDTSRSIEVTWIQISKSDFQPKLMHLCRVSFFTTLDIYKAYFRGCYIWEYNENICKRWPMPYSFWKKLLRLYALGFCNQVLLDLHCWWSEELCSQQSSSIRWISHVLGAAHHWLVMYWNSCKKVAFIYWSV